MRVVLPVLEKLIALLLLFLAALLLCGIFGALHDQVSYTISREYFTLFKFRQFGIDSGVAERLGAASVGFQATWWMGIPIGATLGTIALFAPNARVMLRETFRAFALVTAVTAIAALIGAVWGAITFICFSSAVPEAWFVPKGVQDLPAYLCAGAMHNASYLGGLVGLLVGAGQLGYRLSRLRWQKLRSPTQRTSEPVSRILRP